MLSPGLKTKEKTHWAFLQRHCVWKRLPSTIAFHRAGLLVQSKSLYSLALAGVVFIRILTHVRHWDTALCKCLPWFWNCQSLPFLVTSSRMRSDCSKAQHSQTDQNISGFVGSHWPVLNAAESFSYTQPANRKCLLTNEKWLKWVLMT